jgi:O-antigen/teichoic acid export membrane protein
MSVIKNTAYNLVGAVVPMVVSIVCVPVYLGLIGDERYGVMAIVWTFLGYFGLFDLGLGQATAQRIAATPKSDLKERSETLWTGLALNAALGLAGAALLWLVAEVFFNRYFKVSAQLHHEVLATVPWLSVTLPLALVSGVLSGALQGCERFKEVNLTSVIGTILGQLIPLFVVWVWGANLVWMVCSALLTRCIIVGVLFAQCSRFVPLSKSIAVRKNLIMPLFRFGGWMTLTAIVGPILTSLDRFLIGSISGAKAVTYYTVPFNFVSRVLIIPGGLSNALFPRFAACSIAEQSTLLKKSLATMNVIQTPIVVAGILLIEPFLRFWISPEFASRAGVVGQIIALGLWFNGLAFMPYVQLQAQGRPGYVAICHLGELPFYLLALFAGLHFWGVVGAASAWALRVAADLMLLLWGSRMGVSMGSSFLAPIALLACSLGLAIDVPSDKPVYWLISFGLSGISLTWAWLNSPDDVKNLVGRLLYTRSKRMPD